MNGKSPSSFTAIASLKIEWGRFVYCLFLIFLASEIPAVDINTNADAAVVSSQSNLSPQQHKVNHAWNHLVDNFDGFQQLFAKDAHIKMCLKGMPFCTEGTFPEMLEGFRVAFSSFQVKHKFLTGQQQQQSSSTSSSDFQDTFLVEWVNSIETKEGCRAIWWGYATYEFNEHGKIQRFLALSEESQDVIDCVSKISGINAEL